MGQLPDISPYFYCRDFGEILGQLSWYSQRAEIWVPDWILIGSRRRAGHLPPKASFSNNGDLWRNGNPISRLRLAVRTDARHHDQLTSAHKFVDLFLGQHAA